MDIAALFAFVKAYGFATVAGVVAIYVLLKGEFTFRYPAGPKRKS